jgi:osmotically-inducible protein OsmY
MMTAKRRFKSIRGGSLLLFISLAALSAAPLTGPFQSAPANTAKAASNAGDQKNNRADVKLAAQIRRAIYKDKQLSTRAHNVTIIVVNGAVTLRGEVKTAGEKDSIHRKAAALAGPGAVTDLLTIKSQ